MNAVSDDRICIDTPLGTLVAYTYKNQNHCGIYVDLKTEEEYVMKPLVLVEYSDDDADTGSGGHIISSIWEDVTTMEAAHRVIHKEIERF